MFYLGGAAYDFRTVKAVANNISETENLSDEKVKNQHTIRNGRVAVANVYYSGQVWLLQLVGAKIWRQILPPLESIRDRCAHCK